MRQPARPSPAPSPPGSARCASTTACAAPSRRRIGNLTLLSPDPAKRFEAAKAVFKSKDASMLATLDTAIGKEADARVKKALEEARAAIVVGKPDAKEADRVAAIAVLRDRGDQDARSVLAGVAGDQPANVQKALGRRHHHDRQSPGRLERGAEPLVRALAGLGAAARRHRARHHLRRHGRDQHGARRDGDARRLHDLRRAGGDPHQGAGLFDYSLAIAIPLAFLVAALVGMAIERGVIRFLYGRPLETLLATWGISLILQQAVRTSFGPTNREVGAPNFMSGAFELGGLTITWNRLWIIVFAGDHLRRACWPRCATPSSACRCGP